MRLTACRDSLTSCSKINNYNLNFLSYEKTAEKNYLKAVPAWLSLILAAHHVPLQGVCRESHRVIRSAPNAARSQARTA